MCSLFHIHLTKHLEEVLADGFGVIVIGSADKPQSVRCQQPTVISVTAQLLVFGNLFLGECLFHGRVPSITTLLIMYIINTRTAKVNRQRAQYTFQHFSKSSNTIGSGRTSIFGTQRQRKLIIRSIFYSHVILLFGLLISTTYIISPQNELG